VKYDVLVASYTRNIIICNSDLSTSCRNDRPLAQIANKTPKILLKSSDMSSAWDQKAPPNCSACSGGWCKVQGSLMQKVAGKHLAGLRAEARGGRQ